MFWVAHSKETEHPKYLNSNSADPKLQRMLPAKCRSSPAAARRSLPAAPCCELTSRSPAPPRSRAGSSPSLPAVLLLTGRGPPLLAVSSRRIRRQLPIAPRRELSSCSPGSSPSLTARGHLLSPAPPLRATEVCVTRRHDPYLHSGSLGTQNRYLVCIICWRVF